MPARRSAARTVAMRRALSASAALAVGATATTPALIRARSGTRLASPVATTSRRVPAIAGAGAGCAPAAASRAAARRLFIPVTPSWGREAHRLALTPDELHDC